MEKCIQKLTSWSSSLRGCIYAAWHSGRTPSSQRTTNPQRCERPTQGGGNVNDRRRKEFAGVIRSLELNRVLTLVCVSVCVCVYARFVRVSLCACTRTQRYARARIIITIITTRTVHELNAHASRTHPICSL